MDNRFFIFYFFFFFSFVFLFLFRNTFNNYPAKSRGISPDDT